MQDDTRGSSAPPCQDKVASIIQNGICREISSHARTEKQTSANTTFLFHSVGSRAKLCQLLFLPDTLVVYRGRDSMNAIGSQTAKMSTQAPFGTWDSPITSQYVAHAVVSFEDVLVDPLPSQSNPDGNAVYYIERRPSEGGRSVLVDASTKQDVFGSDWNARTGVYEYGGASTVVYGGVVYFSSFADNRVYKIDRNTGTNQPTPVTPENTDHRFANFTVYPTSPHLLVAVFEDNKGTGPADVINTLVTINANNTTVSTLVEGSDFYAAPTFSPDGSRLAWIEWNHPDMPWQAAQVFVAEVIINDDESVLLKNRRLVKETSNNETAVRPQWIDSNTLLFFSDVSDFLNPWIADVADSSSEPRPVFSSPVNLEFSEPDWNLGMASSTVLTKSTAFAIAINIGQYVLYLLDLNNGTLTDLAAPYVVMKNIRFTGSRSAVFLGAKYDEPAAVVAVSLDDSGKAQYTELAGGGSDSSIGKEYFSTPEPRNLGTEDNPLYAIFYAPANKYFTGPTGEKPPCIVFVHGGPTGMANEGFDIRKQFFTSRGFAILDVNYGGSSGYGRKYIERLNGNWGILDVTDSEDAVQALSNSIDSAHVMITGGSSGGYTVLQSLSSPRSKTYAGGTSSYGISNLLLLTEDTEKFESHYMDKLLGGRPEDIPDVYKERSPVNHADQINVPVLILQGEIDPIVPMEQSNQIVEEIKKAGGTVEYKTFPGEGHGWRKEETIIEALDTELDFYLKRIYSGDVSGGSG